MSQENRINSDGPENISYSNTKIQLAVGMHYVDTEKAYIANRRRIEDIGIHFFRRGYKNILFTEGVLGGGLRFIEINDSAKKFNSYRIAYWHLAWNQKDTDAVEATQLFEQNPVERFVRVGKAAGLNEQEVGMRAFTYSLLAAIDNTKRKGFNVQLAGEMPSVARKELRGSLEALGESASSWRKVALLSQKADRELARQIEGIMSQFPQRTRLLAVFGSMHAPIQENLLPNLRQISEVVQLDPDRQNPELVVLLHDIQKGGLTDEEIEQRVNKDGRFRSRKVIQF